MTLSPAEVQKASDILSLAASPTRLSILLLLQEYGTIHAGAFSAAGLGSQSLVSRHAALLRTSGLIETERAGRNILYGLTELGKKLAAGVKRVVGADAMPALPPEVLKAVRAARKG